MDCFCAKCISCIVACLMAYQVALSIAQDPGFEWLNHTHKGIYAGDCLVQRVTWDRCYTVATVDRDVKQRTPKSPGDPTRHLFNLRYNIEWILDNLQKIKKWDLIKLQTFTEWGKP